MDEETYTILAGDERYEDLPAHKVENLLKAGLLTATDEVVDLETGQTCPLAEHPKFGRYFTENDQGPAVPEPGASGTEGQSGVNQRHRSADTRNQSPDRPPGSAGETASQHREAGSRPEQEEERDPGSDSAKEPLQQIKDFFVQLHPVVALGGLVVLWGCCGGVITIASWGDDSTGTDDYSTTSESVSASSGTEGLATIDRLSKTTLCTDGGPTETGTVFRIYGENFGNLGGDLKSPTAERNHQKTVLFMVEEWSPTEIKAQLNGMSDPGHYDIAVCPSEEGCSGSVPVTVKNGCR